MTMTYSYIWHFLLECVVHSPCELLVVTPVIKDVLIQKSIPLFKDRVVT